MSKANSSVLVGRLAKVAGVLVASLLAIGSTGVGGPADAKFVARTNTLNPTPYVEPPVEPVVKTEIVQAPAPAPAPQQVETDNTAPAPQTAGSGSLTGSLGYARAGGNCVNEPGVKRGQGGNPSSWSASTRTPYIGATFLFYSNHTGVVTGIWANGDVEVRHQNYSANIHRFPASMFRGFI